MLVYFSLLAIILFICAFPSYNPEKNNIKLFFCILLIFLFMALRVDYGGDYSSYEEYYNYFHTGGSIATNTVEMGFYWLSYIMPSYRMLLVFISILFCGALYFLFRHYIPVRYWAFAFFILFISKSMLIGNMSGIRNSIAVSAFIYGLYFLENGYKLRYILLMIGASFFHTSALIFLPAIFITPSKLSKIEITLIIVIIISFSLVSAISPERINELVKLTISTSYFSRYETYLVNEKISGLRRLSYLLLLFMLYLNIKTLTKPLTKRESLLIKLSILYFIVMLAPSIGLMSRLYFFLGFPFLVGSIYIIQKENNIILRYTYTGCILLMFSMEFYSFAMSERFALLYLNYHSIL